MDVQNKNTLNRFKHGLWKIQISLRPDQNKVQVLNMDYILKANLAMVLFISSISYGGWRICGVSREWQVNLPTNGCHTIDQSWRSLWTFRDCYTDMWRACAGVENMCQWTPAGKVCSSGTKQCQLLLGRWGDLCGDYWLLGHAVESLFFKKASLKV